MADRHRRPHRNERANEGSEEARSRLATQRKLFRLSIDPNVRSGLQAAIRDNATMIGRFIKTRKEGLP